MVSAERSSLSAVKAEAAAGYFRAIALWLNQPLVERGIYVQVQGERHGCLELLVEFHQPPKPDPLIRFICHRIWQLNSPVIEGVHIQGRPVGNGTPLWQRRVRVVSAHMRQAQATSSQRQAKGATPAHLPPRISRPRPLPAEGLNRQVKTLRAFLLSGSAVAAFILGCLMEVILTGGPSLPSFATQRRATDTQAESVDLEVTPISYSVDRSSRSPIVDAAVEPVAVIPYPTAQDDPQVTLLFGGDFPLDGLPPEVLDNQVPLLSGVDAYQEADVAMMNLGTSLAVAATSLDEGYHHRTRTDAAALLKASGVDIVNLSDEDIMAYGEEGLAETLETLDREGILRVGAGRNESEARRPEVLEVKGQRIAYLSYARGGDYAAHQDRGGVNAQDLQEIADDIRALRDEVDWIVINYRWETDIGAEPASWQTNLARLAIDQGADLVVGYHPTQLQGSEIYRGRPIAYSLGDFIFEQPPEPGSDARPVMQVDQDTAVLKVSLGDEQMKVEFLPVQVRQAHPQMASGRAAQQILERIEQASAAFERPASSPILLDRKGAQPQPEAEVAPESPFIQVEPNLLPSTESPNLPATPAESGEDWQLELETPITEDLQDWGPKLDSTEEFVPIPEVEPEPTEETAPATQSVDYRSHAPGPIPEVSAPSTPVMVEPEALPPAEVASPSSPEPKAAPMLDGPALTPATIPPPKGIAPYSEPLVGPLGAAEPDQQVAWGAIETKAVDKAVSPESAEPEARLGE